MSSKPETARASFYLPDFCDARSVFAVVLITGLVAMVLTLAREEPHFTFWTDLARTSMFLLWIGLVSAAVLCGLRRWLERMSTRSASMLALASLVSVILVVSEVTFWLGRGVLDNDDGLASLFPSNHLSFLLRNLFIGFIVSALALRYFFISHEWRRSVELKARSRLDALQARIRPHFLFNSMNTIAALTRSDPALAEKAVEDLADLFRANLNETRNWIALQEELEVARLYQGIEALRLGARLKVHWDIEGLPMEMPVPSLLVQPLLENAIYHGIERLPEGGTITVRGRQIEGSIELTVCNPVPVATDKPGRSGNRIALDNIRERLQLAYPGRARMSVETPDNRFQVTLRFPAS